MEVFRPNSTKIQCDSNNSNLIPLISFGLQPPFSEWTVRSVGFSVMHHPPEDVTIRFVCPNRAFAFATLSSRTVSPLRISSALLPRYATLLSAFKGHINDLLKAGDVRMSHSAYNSGAANQLNAATLYQHYEGDHLRSSAHSDAGSSSCKDMDEPEVCAPDSIPALVDQLRKLIYYVESKPALAHGSASFMRDYLRTMLLENSVMAQDVIQASSKAHKKDVAAGRKPPAEHFKHIPEELAKHIFSFLDGEHLARTREVCRKWNEFASEEPLWKALCLKKWKSLETDEHLWRLISRNIPRDSPNRWKKIYPEVQRSAQWNCRLQKTGKFICNLIAHQISGTPVGELGLPSILIVERRFNILHLQTFVLPDAAVLYFEPEQESDKAGFNDFIEYLNRRTRAGLALEDQRRFIFIPPCEYTRTQVEYHGSSLLGVVQNAYPPLAP